MVEAEKYKDYHTISLMSHVLKVFLRIIHVRIFKKSESYVSNIQFGFKHRVSIKEALFALNTHTCTSPKRTGYKCKCKCMLYKLGT